MEGLFIGGAIIGFAIVINICIAQLKHGLASMEGTLTRYLTSASLAAESATEADAKDQVFMVKLRMAFQECAEEFTLEYARSCRGIVDVYAQLIYGHISLRKSVNKASGKPDEPIDITEYLDTLDGEMGEVLKQLAPPQFFEVLQRISNKDIAVSIRKCRHGSGLTG